MMISSNCKTEKRFLKETVKQIKFLESTLPRANKQMQEKEVNKKSGGKTCLIFDIQQNHPLGMKLIQQLIFLLSAKLSN